MTPTANLTALCDSALDYRARGWSVLPTTSDKRPATRAWACFQRTQASEAVIRGWFKPKALGGRVAGVGIILGEVSGGLVVRDFDDEGAYAEWAEANPDLAKTLPTVRTSRGFHVYARCPGCSTRKVEGGELRAEGAYVVAPPSLHESGVQYQWLIAPDAAVPTVEGSAFGIKEADAPSGTQETQDKQAIWPVVRGAPESRVCLETPANPGHLGAPAPLGSLVSEQDTESFVAESIRQTVPAGVGGRNSGVFQFARRLKAHPAFAGRKASELRPEVKRWYEAALPVIGTKDFDTTWAEFCYAWPRVKAAYGATLAEALAAALSAPHPTCCAAYDARETRDLIRLCRELQSRAEDAPFFLTARAAGEAVGLNKTHANTRLGMLVEDGILTRVHKGHSGRASEYRYQGD